MAAAQKSDLKGHADTLGRSFKEQALQTNYIKRHINKIRHLVRECFQLAQRDYTRTDNIARYINLDNI